MCRRVSAKCLANEFFDFDLFTSEVPYRWGNPPRGNKRVAGGGGWWTSETRPFISPDGTGIAYPRIPKSKVDNRAELLPASPSSPMQYIRVGMLKTVILCLRDA